VRVGFAGHYKVGLWTPVEVSLRGGSPDVSGKVSLTVPDGDGVPSRVSLPVARGETSVVLYARFGRVNSEMTVEYDYRGEEGPVAGRVFKTSEVADDAHFRPAIAAGQKMIVSVGVDPLGVEGLVELTRRETGEQVIAVRLEDCSQLPAQWYGYEGVDTLVLSTSEPEIFTDLKPDGARIAALAEWIRMGGRLVLCIGSRAEEVLSDEAPVRQFAPGRLQEMVPLGSTQTRSLESYAASSTAIPPPGIRVPHLADVEGVVEAREGSLPLVVRRAWGFGQIVFLATDLDRPPVSEWKDRSLLVGRLLDFPTGRAEEAEDGSAMMHYGFNDLSGQLRSALDQFAGLRLVPFWAVAAMVFVYILLIGPVDYFFLRKVVGRMQWTWVTFPSIVLVVCLAAWGLAYYLKGNELRANQVDLVDVDAASGYVRGTSWANVFSPRTESYDLSLRPKPLDTPPAPNARVLFSWMGLPGSFLGGMNPKASNPTLWSEPYEFSPQLYALEGVPIQIWSTKSFTARWYAQTRVCPKADLVVEGQIVSGRITNTLSFPLADCLLAHGQYAYQLGSLLPGQSARIETRIRSSLKTLLTQRRFVEDVETGTHREVATAYDRSSVDVPYIVRTMMFFQAAGGRTYTGLSNGYQGFVDTSILLKTDRAILVARGPDRHHGAELLRDGELITEQADRHVVFYRFAFPVESSGE
jgi:hypothetical protein